jgi:Flp pilus assembly protein TadD
LSIGLKLRWLFVKGKVNAHNTEGIALFHEHKFPEAEAELRKAIDIFPEHEVAHCNLGMVLMSQNRLREAESEYRAAIRINQEYADGFGELGSLYHKLGRKADARRYYDQAIKLNPYNAYFHINLATLMRDEGDFSGADKEYKFALTCPMLDEETKSHVQELLGG